MRKKFNISCVSKIDTIGARAKNKLFIKFASIDNYYSAYLKVYIEIANRLANKNDHK